MTAPLLNCVAIEQDGLLVRLIDDQLPESSSEAILEHLHDCAECLRTLAQVLEIHGQVLIDEYWNAARKIDPRNSATASN